MSSLTALDRSPVSPSPKVTETSEHPLVSIIIPCYNGAAFLAETLESALTQTYPHVEVIVIDDGSTDRSGEIAQSYPVRYIHQENRGLTPTRNRGIEMSLGSYVIFLDADDRLKPEAVETGLRVLGQHPECAMAVGDHLFVSYDGSYLAGSRKKCLASAHYEALLQSNFIEMISSVLFRKSVFQTAGVFNPELRVAEDYELYLRIAREHAICSHPTVVAEYRLHQANASRNSELMLTMTLDVLKGQRAFIHGDPKRQHAFDAGRARWRKQYGRQLATEIARSFSSLHGNALSRKLLTLLRHYPQGLGILVLLKLMPSLGKQEGTRRRGTVRPVIPYFEKLQVWASPSKPPSKATIG